jgi:hypothetical protein
MGKQTAGIFGAWSGRVATLVGSSIYGKATIRTYREKIANPRTAAQVAQRQKFDSVLQLALLINSTVLLPCWKRFVKGMSSVNAFISKNVAFGGENGAPAFESLTMSFGKLLMPEVISSSMVDGVFTLGIADNNDAYGLATDELYHVAIAGSATEPRGYVIVSSGNTGLTRADNSFAVDFSEQQAGQRAYVWLFYRRADGTYLGTSSYAYATITD